MSNISIPKDSAELINLLQTRLNAVDSALAKIKADQSISDIARISIETGDKIYAIEHIVIVVFTALMLLFLYFMARKYTFGNWTKDNPNPYKDETLAMPKGTMRGIITFTLLFFTVLIESHAISNPLIELWTDKYITSFQMVLAFYFGSQVMAGITTKEVEKTQIMKGQVQGNTPIETSNSSGAGTSSGPGSNAGFSTASATGSDASMSDTSSGDAANDQTAESETDKK